MPFRLASIRRKCGASSKSCPVWRACLIFTSGRRWPRGSQPKPFLLSSRVSAIRFGAGVVPSLARPGGNATGISLLASELSAKRLELLREIVPSVSRVAMLWNDTNPSMVLRAQETRDAAPKLGVIVQSVGIHDLIDFETAFLGIESWQPMHC